MINYLISAVDSKTIAIIAICVVIVALLLMIISAIMVKSAKKKKIAKAKDNGVVVKDNVRYSSDQAMLDASKDDVTYTEKDRVLSAHKTYKVGKDEYILPGKYTILSANGQDDAFNVRIGQFVREYKHGTDIVVGEGEQITPISHNIIIR